MNNINTYPELLEFKKNVLSSAQHDNYAIFLGFILVIIGINIILFFVNHSQEKQIHQLKIIPKSTSFLDIITPPQAGQQMGDDYFNNADLPNKKN